MKIIEITDKQHFRQMRKDSNSSLCQYAKSITPPWQFSVDRVYNFRLFNNNHLTFVPWTYYYENAIRDEFTIMFNSELLTKSDMTKAFHLTEQQVDHELVELAKVWFNIPDLKSVGFNLVTDIYVEGKTAKQKYLEKAKEKGIEFFNSEAFRYCILKNNIQTTPIPDAWKKYTGQS